MHFLLLGMALFQALAILFFVYRGGLSIPNAILFAIYTTTTSGYGSVDIPTENGFLLFLVVYIFLAIAALTILIAEVYMFIAIRTSEAKKAQDQRTLRKHQQHLQQQNGSQSTNMQNIAKHLELAAAVSEQKRDMEETTAQNAAGTVTTPPPAAAATVAIKKQHGRITGSLLYMVARFQSTYSSSEACRFVIVVLYLGMLLLMGTIPMMFLENWTFIEALYFSTFTMTTVGYGDYHPTKTSSTWFAIFWIPLNVSFVSVYMGNLARHYQMICKSNTARNYKILQKQYIAEPPNAAAADDDDDDGKGGEEEPFSQGQTQTQNQSHDIIGASSSFANHSTIATTFDKSIRSFADLHRFVLANAVVTARDRTTRLQNDDWPKILVDILSFPSSSSSSFSSSQIPSNPGFCWNQARSRIPSLVLLVLVQERIGNIIAEEIAGCQSEIISKDKTVIVSFFDMDKTSETWSIPKAAEEAFRQVAFEAILYVGENKLVTIGADALFALSPAEVFDILSPFLAAMADAGTMAGWLASTEQLASLHFPGRSASS